MDFISSREEDISKWYLDIVQNTELADYTAVKGCMIIRPYGFAIWEHIQKELDLRIKTLGYQNAYFPLLIPRSSLEKEKDHVKGFSPELTLVTHAGGKELEEPFVLRPTSEAIMYPTFSKWIQSYRDLPLRLNQWCNIFRWELRTYPFLRTTEFLWQEGHSVHSIFEEAQEEALRILETYRTFFEEVLALPVITGYKSEKEKFPGAWRTHTLEAFLFDGKALQVGTAHNLGQNFSKVFDIQFLDALGKQQYAWQTSWGASTRLIGSLIMVHGDEKGLRLPPKVAPIQLIVVPIWRNEEELNRLKDIINTKIETPLHSKNIRVFTDWRERVTPGWKFNDWELKGVPIRIEIGPRDIQNNQVIIVQRNRGGKIPISLDSIENIASSMLEEIQVELLKEAKTFINSNIVEIHDFDIFLKMINECRQFFKTSWCGDRECEDEIKNYSKASIRCIPLDDQIPSGNCIYCGKPGRFNVFIAQAH